MIRQSVPDGRSRWERADILQASRFILVGTANTLIGLSSIYAAKGICGFDDFVSNAIGYGFGLLVSFFLNRKWTFRHNGRISSTAIRFFSAFLVSYLANLAMVYGVRDGLGFNSYLAQASGIIPYTVIFYFTCKYYVFIETNHPH